MLLILTIAAVLWLAIAQRAKAWLQKSGPLKLTPLNREASSGATSSNDQGEKGGVVRQNVDRAEGGDSVVDELCAFRRNGDIGLDRDEPRAGLSPNLGCGLSRGLAVASGDDDIGARCGEGLGDGPADPDAAASHDRGLSREVERRLGSARHESSISLR